MQIDLGLVLTHGAAGPDPKSLVPEPSHLIFFYVKKISIDSACSYSIPVLPHGRPTVHKPLCYFQSGYFFSTFIFPDFSRTFL